MKNRIKFGCMIMLTTRCQHKCTHCMFECSPQAGIDMPEEIFRAVVDKASGCGLLGHVTVAGGEPFIDVDQLLWALRHLLNGNGVLDVFIPTNGRWVLRPDYGEIVDHLRTLSGFVPHGITTAFSRNIWNLAQLGSNAEVVINRWEEIENRYPEIFITRTLAVTDMKRVGRARLNNLAKTGDHVGAHCDYDDWIDPAQNLGFFTDYLGFWPDGTVKTCYSGGPVLGHYTDDFEKLLEYRARYLSWIRLTDSGDEAIGSLSFRACESCNELFKAFQCVNGITDANQ